MPSLTFKVHLDGEPFAMMARQGDRFESWISKARYFSSPKVHTYKKWTLSCTLHKGVASEAGGLAQSLAMVGTPEILVATGRLRKLSPVSWAGSWGREEKAGEISLLGFKQNPPSPGGWQVSPALL